MQKGMLILRMVLSFMLLNLFGIESIAQNENDAVRLAVPGIISDARTLGIGNSNMTRNSTYSAMIFNPAGLALSDNSQLTGSFYYRYFENNSLFFDQKDYYKNSSTELNQLGYMYKAPTTRGSLVYGFGYQKDKDFTSSLSFNGFNPNSNSMINNLTRKNDDVPYLLGLSYPLYDNNDRYIGDTTIIGGELNQSGSQLAGGEINRYSFGAGIEVAKGAYIGGSVNYLSGEYKNNREYYEDDVYGIYTDPTDINDLNTINFNTFSFNDELFWNMNAWEFRFGFIIDWLNFIRIGGSTKLATTYNIKEKYKFSAYSQFDKDYFIDILPSESNVEYEIKTPMEFSLGASVNLHIVNINGQVTFVDYSQTEFSGGLDESVIAANNKAINSNFRAALNYNLGAELKIPFTEIRARAGIIYQMSPYKNDPKEFDKVFLNAGVGIVVGDALSFDVAYSYGFWETYSDNYGVNQSRVFQEINSHTVIVSTTILY